MTEDHVATISFILYQAAMSRQEVGFHLIPKHLGFPSENQYFSARYVSNNACGRVLSHVADICIKIQSDPSVETFCCHPFRSIMVPTFTFMQSHIKNNQTAVSFFPPHSLNVFTSSFFIHVTHFANQKSEYSGKPDITSHSQPNFKPL